MGEYGERPHTKEGTERHRLSGEELRQRYEAWVKYVRKQGWPLKQGQTPCCQQEISIRVPTHPAAKWGGLIRCPFCEEWLATTATAEELLIDLIGGQEEDGDEASQRG